MRFDPAVFGAAWFENRRPADFFLSRSPEELVAGEAALACVYDFSGERPERNIGVSSSGEVALLHLCARGGASVGPHPIELIPESGVNGGIAVFTQYTAADDSETPQMESGAVRLSGETVEPATVRARTGSCYRVEDRLRPGFFERQLTHLVRLVDDLLDVSRITHNRLELRELRLHLGPLLRQIAESRRSGIRRSSCQARQARRPDEAVGRLIPNGWLSA